MDIRFKKQIQINMGLGFDTLGAPLAAAVPIVIDANHDGLNDLLFTTLGDFTKGSTVPYEAKLLVSNGTTLVDGTEAYLPAGFSTLGTRTFDVGDFNGDGYLDIFFGNHGSESTPVIMGEQNRLLLGGANGFTDATDRLPQRSGFTHGAGAGDFDGDGDLDIYVNDWINLAYLMLNDGTGHFTIVDSYRSPEESWFIERDLDGNELDRFTNYYAEVFDMNGDGFADIWTSGINRDYSNLKSHDIFRALINDGHGHLGFSPTSGDFPMPADVEHTAGEQTYTGDIDHDGDIDLLVWTSNDAVGNYVGHGFQLLINDGLGNFTEESAERGVGNARYNGYYPAHETLVDFDGDGDLDIVAPLFSAAGATELDVLENAGDGTFTRVPHARWPQQLRPTGFTVIDMNDDGLPDLFTDMMPLWPWSEGNHEKQFLLYKGSINVSVNRTGWFTSDAIAGGSKADTLKGVGGDDTLRGNGGDDKLQGNAGADVLRGGLGKDKLSGGAANDRFVFDTKLSKTNIDTVADFKHDTDLIVLDRDIFTKLGGDLKPGQFYSKAGAAQAFDRSDRIIYDPKSGKLFYDDDGSKRGGHDAVHFATLAGHPKLDFGDFDIV